MWEGVSCKITPAESVVKKARQHFVFCFQIVSILEGPDGKMNYVLSQPGTSATNFGTSGFQLVADTNQFPHLQSAIGPVIQVEGENVQTAVPSPVKKGTF